MQLLKSFSIYTFVGFFGAAVGFIVMPILTHYLSPEDYGIIALFNTYTSFLVPIVGLTASGLISVEYFNKKYDQKAFASVYSSILSIPILPVILLLIIGYIFVDRFSLLLEIPSSHILLLPLLAILTYYSQHLLNFLAITKKPVKYAAVNIGKVTIEVSLTLFLVIYLGMNWKGRIDSWFIVLVLIFAYLLIFSSGNKLVSSSIKMEHIKAGATFGFPLILHSIGKIIVNQSDRIFISKMVSIQEMGIYNTGYQVGSLLLILSAAFVNIYNPFLYERLADMTEQKKTEILRLAYAFLGTLLLVLIFITLFTPYLYKYFMDERFADGARYVFLVGLSYFFWGAYLILTGFIFYFKKTKILGFLAVLNVVINLLGNYYFILNYGPIGAAYATVLSFFIVFVLVGIFSYRIYPMPWFDFKRIIGRS